MELHRCYGCMNLVTEEVCPHCGHSVTEGNLSHQLPMGTVLKGQYQVGRALGQGGFGITYIGMDIHLEQVVAIKEFFPSSVVNRDCAQSLSVQMNAADMVSNFQDNRARFLREAQTLAKMSHVSQIVDVMGFFEENNTAYIIMEYVRGSDLKHYVRQRGGRVSAQELLPLMEPVLRALDTVHKAGLVHRDISPDNIMILPDGEIKLLDFGAVRGVDNLDADIDLSHSTEAILKHGFAPMEQYRSRGNLGPWTDEYGICASFYYCLTGKVPPDAPARAMGDEDVDWSTVSGLTDSQRAALEKGMSMRAKDRFGNLEELRQAIYEGKMIQPGQKSVPAPQPPEPKKKKKRKVGGLIAAVLVAAVLGGGAWWFLNSDFPESVLGQPSEETLPAETTLPTQLQEVISTVPMETEPPATETEPPETVEMTVEAWEENLIRRDPLDELGLERSQIYGVTFLNTVESAPYNAVDVSYRGDGSVLAWKEWKDRAGVKIAQVYIGAEGGINGRYACEGLFKNCINLESVSCLDRFHTDQAESMAYMFYDCDSLSGVDFSQLDTSNVKDMSYMFALHSWGYVWDSLDLISFDTGNVENMSHMFAERQGTYFIGTSVWDMRKVKDISGMFKNCTMLSRVYVDNWELSSLENMSEVFLGCQDLTSIGISDWDVSNVRDMSYAFQNCIFLEKLDVSKWDVSSVENMNSMFCNCIRLKELEVENWDVSSVTDMTAMFWDCDGLTQPDFTGWDVSNVTAYERFLEGNALIGTNFWKYHFQQ